MLKTYLALVILVVSACAESVRETETWIKPSNDVNNDLVSSGDFGFSHEDVKLTDDDDEDDADDYDADDDEDMSGSGDESTFDYMPTKTEEIDNRISDILPKPKDTAYPLDKEITAVRNNEVAYQPSIHLSQAGEQNIFNKKEVLAAVIAGGAVGLLFAVLLVLLLVYRMKKKDEGSYELGKKPIYKKAPTAEIYA